MRVSRKQVEENKQTILTAAGRLFRERGFDAVTVTDIMQSAGLTHGGFYGYFQDAEARRRAAIGSWSAMVGALILARMTADSAFSDEILAETAAWLAEKQR